MTLPPAAAASDAFGEIAILGDAEDPELPESLPLDRGCWVVSSVPSLPVGLFLLRLLRERNFSGRVAVTAHGEDDARVLEAAGADLVLRPFADAAAEAVDRLEGELPGDATA